MKIVLSLFVIMLASVRAQELFQFEGRQTHPVQLSADGQRLYVLNTPDGKPPIRSPCSRTAAAAGIST